MSKKDLFMRVITEKDKLKRGRFLCEKLDLGELDLEALSERDLECIALIRTVDIDSDEEDLNEVSSEKVVKISDKTTMPTGYDEQGNFNPSFEDILKDLNLIYVGDNDTRYQNLVSLSSVDIVPQRWRKFESKDILEKVEALEEKSGKPLIVYGQLRTMLRAYEVYDLITGKYADIYKEYTDLSEEEKTKLYEDYNKFLASIKKEMPKDYVVTTDDIIKEDKRFEGIVLDRMFRNFNCEIYFLLHTSKKNLTLIKKIAKELKK